MNFRHAAELRKSKLSDGSRLPTTILLTGRSRKGHINLTWSKVGQTLVLLPDAADRRLDGPDLWQEVRMEPPQHHAAMIAGAVGRASAERFSHGRHLGSEPEH